MPVIPPRPADFYAELRDWQERGCPSRDGEPLIDLSRPRRPPSPHEPTVLPVLVRWSRREIYRRLNERLDAILRPVESAKPQVSREKEIGHGV